MPYIDAHGHGGGTSHAAHGPEPLMPEPQPSQKTIDGASNSSLSQDIEKGNAASSSDVQISGRKAHVHERHEHDHGHGHGALDDSALAQIIGIAVLEFGVMLHSILIGLTLAVDEDFKVLFVVIVFHRECESILSLLHPAESSWFPVQQKPLRDWD